MNNEELKKTEAQLTGKVGLLHAWKLKRDNFIFTVIPTKAGTLNVIGQHHFKSIGKHTTVEMTPETYDSFVLINNLSKVVKHGKR